MSARRRKTLLYCGPDPATFESLASVVADVARAEQSPARRGLTIRHTKADLTLLPAFTLREAMDTLATTFLNLIVIDLRFSDDPADQQARVEEAWALLDRLDDVSDIEARFGFHRIVVLVSGPDGAFIDQVLVELGGRGVRHVLKERRFRADETPQGYARRVLNLCLRLLFAPRDGQMALAAAGGGITAIFFELGALKCLDDCLADRGVNDLDMFFGISAGAVVTSLLANGFAAEEFMAAIAGYRGGRLDPIDLSLARVGHLNTRDMAWRLGVAARAVARSAVDVLRGRPGPTIDGVFLGATSLVGAPFHSDRYEETLRGVFALPGATNRFRHLRRPLYIGATNQDTRRHTLFGAAPFDRVPISRAVQASLSLNPAFSAVEISGSWYEDGQVTRTSNFYEAIRRNADLIFVLDPFVPYHSREPGFAYRRGMLYNIDQDVRSLSFTRFEAAQSHALRRHPRVSSYTFVPNNSLRHILSINPMDHRVYLPLFQGAYLGTLRRLQHVAYRLRGDLALRGVTLDMAPAEAIAERLEAAGEGVALEDFFPDGRIDLRTPPLSLNHTARPDG